MLILSGNRGVNVLLSSVKKVKDQFFFWKISAKRRFFRYFLSVRRQIYNIFNTESVAGINFHFIPASVF
jgi:hypothetical protein